MQINGGKAVEALILPTFKDVCAQASACPSTWAK